MKRLPLRVSELTDRSDIDRDAVVDPDALGSDWGDGFFVQQEPVLIKRDSAGNIVRTIPLTELEAMQELRRNAEIAEQTAKLVDPVATPKNTIKTTSDRDKIVYLIAKRLWDWYGEDAQMIDKSFLNPIRDGIPVCPVHLEGCPLTRCEKTRRVTKKYATPAEVLDWLVRVVAARAKVVNKHKGWQGYMPSVTISREVNGGNAGSNSAKG